MRTRRRLFSFGFAASLLLFAATLGLWVQSAWKPVTYLLVAHPSRTIFVGSSRGRLRVWSQEVTPAPPEGIVATLTVPHEVSVGTLTRTLRGGVKYEFPDKQYEWSSRQLIGRGSIGNAKGSYNFSVFESHFQLAWWLPAMVSLLPVGVLLSIWTMRRRRFWMGKCQTCSYDLTGNASGVCPECGTAIASNSP